MTNELQTVNQETGEIIAQDTIINETEDFIVIKDKEGKFKRKAKFHDYSSFTPESREDKLWLLKLIDSDESSGIGMALSEHVGKEIEIEDVIFKKYDKVDENTGELLYGVLTYLITPDRKAYVTSSKSVYFTLDNMMQVLGTPDTEDWENVKVKVGSKRTQNGNQILIHFQ